MGIAHERRLSLAAWIGADAPTVRRDRLPVRAYGWALAAVVLCTLVDHLWVRPTAEANLIMVYLAGNLLVALRGDRGAAVGAAVGSVAAFDFFFVHPYLTFAVQDTGYVFTFLVMGLVGGVISTLTARLVQQIAYARRREARARALYELSRCLLAPGRPRDLMRAGAQVLGRELGLPIRAWLREGEGGELRLVEAVPMLDESPGGPTPGRGLFPVSASGPQLGALEVVWHGEGPIPAEVEATLATGANQMAIALEQVRAREEADAARAQAEAEQLRSALLSSVSHDLRTPLAGIVGAASSLLDGAEALEPSVRRELAQGIVEEADRLNRLVTNLLHATRLDAGAVRLHRTWFSLDEVVAPAVARLQTLLAHHPLEVDLPDDLPWVDADPVLLEQVLHNLLENAALHTPAGTRLQLRARPQEASIQLELLDEGPGLPPGEEEHVFEKFRRFPRAGRAQGAGLGLSICRGIVEAHGGTLTASNRREGGARFLLELPLSAPPQSHEEVA